MKNIKDKLTGKTVFITGATSGIGIVTAIQLALHGATVVAAYRDFSKAEILMIEFNKQRTAETNGLIDLIYCDLSSIASINNACESLIENYKQLDILINNAGVWNWKFIKSKDGYEETFAVNVLAPILITNNLLEMMAHRDSKIIYTSSKLHGGIINFNDIELKKSFRGFMAYRQSKLCDIIIARYYSIALEKKAISAYSLHPGVVKTDLGRSANPFFRYMFKSFSISPEKGAETLIYLATEDKRKLKSGEYYANKKITITQSYTYDSVIAEKLIKTAQGYLNKK